MRAAAAGGALAHNLAAATLSRMVAAHEPIGLSEVDATAALQTRTDNTYLVSGGVLAELAAALRSRFRALEINSERLMSYESVYFDTEDFRLFRDHQQGRRQRFKVRTRRYVSTEARFTEIKLKGGRGETVKRRRARAAATPGAVLEHADAEFLTAVLAEEYGIKLPQLRPVLTSLYRRSTLVDPVHGERLTCDVDVAWTRADGALAQGPDLVLLESKTSGRGFVDALLLERGIRPLSMSKYAIGTALLYPKLRANRWARLLRTVYGWNSSRSASAA